MHDWRCTTFTCAVLLLLRSSEAVAQSSSTLPPGGASPGVRTPPAQTDDIMRARVAAAFDAAARCPDLREAVAADDTVARLVFLVGPTGVPSRLSVESSSGSERLDNAAANCVPKLRFQPATRFGDGTPVDSWQRIGWTWASLRQAHQSAEIKHPAAAAEVHVCVDETGKLVRVPTLTHSSGDARFDEAAVRIATSASGAYRAASSDGTAASGCVQLAVKPEPH